ncbi:protein unc-13 homolog isoform X2 [Solanum pennellii]|uniref:Protein unc-13 homolog isoform X1 n=1 Tax=Solanum pennellii TaxID=28526 RepID=A0ABM1V5C6_SOLPN|nr:protein unc-13 homolog isoform X1 [Solanum pennellii]XP_015068320.1 protein unc-13 homolog isoform X3 [Solanum pennellii]XP_027770944.1 protein unc-13 homolog isoform X2 [Solanum pennellii]
MPPQFHLPQTIKTQPAKKSDPNDDPIIVVDLVWPFGDLEGLDRDDFREAAYEIFFTACRSSPGFGGRTAAISSSSDGSGEGNGSGSGTGLSGPGSPKPTGVGMAITSRVKTALGLKMLKKSPSRRKSGGGGSVNGPSSPAGVASPRTPSGSIVQQAKIRRPLTSAEIMRLQMRVSEQSDNRLRKTLMRTLVGQIGRRAETIILPLELLRHLKPSEFNDPQEYHLWQKRQLRILDIGLLLHPSIPVEKDNASASRLLEIIQACEIKTIDTSKNSETMKSLSNAVVSLAWRSVDDTPSDTCRWADGFPLNIHIYTALLGSIFDLKDDTLVLNEVDELLELMKKTWSTLGITRSTHNLCFTWVLFEQYVVTNQVEPDLLGATLTMLTEVANDAKKVDRDPIYLKMLKSVLASMKRWCEKRLLNYHASFHAENIGLMENIIPLMFSASKILEEDVPGYVSSAAEKGDVKDDSTGNQVNHFIRSSLRTAFNKMLEERNINITTFENDDVIETLIKLANATEEMATKEKKVFTPVLKKWHPIAAGVAAVTLHTCYGTLLRQYLAGTTFLTSETALVLQRAGKLEKVLVQMVVEDSVDCEDGGKVMVREMIPYEVDSIKINLLRKWIQDSLKKGKDVLVRSKDSETWNPKSKSEPYAQSAIDLVRHSKEAVDNFFEIPTIITENLVNDIADGIENLFKDYVIFVASCGAKQNYMPALPPLTRCGQDSKFVKMWKKAACSVGSNDPNQHLTDEDNNPRPSTSRGTQRLYVRLNTLHYLLQQLNSLDKTLSLSSRVIASPGSRYNKNRQLACCSFFDQTRSSIQASVQLVSEVAAYRLMFFDSNSVFYASLYVGDVENARIRPALRILKQNLTLLCAILTDRAQALALKEVMRASFEAYLMVLLAGGPRRNFFRMDHQMIEEDFESLKKVFCTCGEGLILEDVVEKEAAIVEEIVPLMGQSTEQLVEDFSNLACETSGVGVVVGNGQKLPMPPTTGKWNRSDANTILRVLCHRNDKIANNFLKKTFHLAKRRG